MLFREDASGLIAITQPAHAWLSGELARLWGNELAGEVEPLEETCLAAEQHDCGWIETELEPRLNPSTGRPFSFLDLPGSEHIAIWTRGPRMASVMNPYTGLLVSLHGTGLYRRYRSGSPDPSVREFIETSERWQEEVVRSLQSDSRYASRVRPDVLSRNQKLLAAWDLLSLHFCMRGGRERRVEGIPAAGEPLNIEVRERAADVHEMKPWPFRDRRIDLHVTGRRIEPPFGSEQAMRDALTSARPETLSIRVEPA
jgi:hypothetical protein